MQFAEVRKSESVDFSGFVDRVNVFHVWFGFIAKAQRTKEHVLRSRNLKYYPPPRDVLSVLLLVKYYPPLREVLVL